MLQDYFLALLDWWKINILLKDNTSTRLFKEAEIWWCSIGMNIGVEIFGNPINHPIKRGRVVYTSFI
jgi:hypothetical protein